METFFSPFSSGDRESLVAHMTTQMAVPSHWHSVGRKRNTEGRQAPSQWLPSSVSISEPILHMYTQGIVAWWLWPATLDREVSRMGLGSRGVVLCPWARHFTCMCSLSTQEWTGAWLDSNCLCVYYFSVPRWQHGCIHAPQRVEFVLEWTLTDTITRGTVVKAIPVQSSAASCLSTTLQTQILKNVIDQGNWLNGSPSTSVCPLQQTYCEWCRPLIYLSIGIRACLQKQPHCVRISSFCSTDTE